MDSNEAYKAPQTNLQSASSKPTNVKPFATRGRLGRGHYVLYSVGLTTLLYILASVMSYLVSFGLGSVLGSPNASEMVAGIIMLISIFGITVMQVYWLIRRCHDFDVTGWLSIAGFIPLVSLIFWFIPGTKGPNQYGNKPPSGPWWILLLLLIPIVGILAAIAIPAYQDYAVRAQVGECMSGSAEHRNRIAEHMQTHDEFPNEGAAGQIVTMSNQGNQYCNYEIDSYEQELVLRFKDEQVDSRLAGKTIIMAGETNPDTNLFIYKCSSETVDSRFLPKSCQ